MFEPMTREAIVRAVRDHAARNYDSGGWDILVECWSDDDIRSAIGRCTTAIGGIVRCEQILRAQHSARREAINA